MREHSLVRDHRELMNDLAQGRFHVNVEVDNATGNGKHRFSVELPPEESMESFAARVRPFTMAREPVHWAKVIDALERLLDQHTLTQVVDLDDLRNHWTRIAEGKRKESHAYFFATENGRMSDVQIADLWLNSDALHSQTIESAIGNDTDLDQRYRAGAGVYARIGACVEDTFNVIAGLFDMGLIEMDMEVFTTQVTASPKYELNGQVFISPEGVPFPTDFSGPPDIAGWTPIHEDPEVVAALKKRAAAS